MITRATRRYVTGSPGSLLASLLAVIALSLLGVHLVDFLIIDATWGGTEAACRGTAGACWAFLLAHATGFVFGYYPAAERWRPTLLLVGLCVSGLLVVLAPGRRHAMCAALCAATLPVVASLLVLSTTLGAPPLAQAQLGGICLTLVLSVMAIAMGLPIGLVLALMRESNMPVLRGVSAVWIELWRGLPTIVVLFFAIAAFPLLVQPGTEMAPVLRALAAFTLLTSALFAEAIRAGLRAVGPGQIEAAKALNLHPVAVLSRIVLPQALRIAAPNLVNVSIALIKETSLILVIGLYDLFGIIQNAATDPRIASEAVTTTGYAIAALGYFTVCFGLSAVTRWLERGSIANN